MKFTGNFNYITMRNASDVAKKKNACKVRLYYQYITIKLFIKGHNSSNSTQRSVQLNPKRSVHCGLEEDNTFECPERRIRGL